MNVLLRASSRNNKTDTAMNGHQIVRDDEGFLLDPDDWNQDLAVRIAHEYEMILSEEHWQVINLIRQCYSETGIVPELRTILRHLKKTLGADKVTRKYVYNLFPYGYGQQGCKIAGMRKPLKLWLDL